MKRTMRAFLAGLIFLALLPCATHAAEVFDPVGDVWKYLGGSAKPATAAPSKAKPAAPAKPQAAPTKASPKEIARKKKGKAVKRVNRAKTKVVGGGPTKAQCARLSAAIKTHGYDTVVTYAWMGGYTSANAVWAAQKCGLR